MILPHVQRHKTKDVYGYDGEMVYRFVCTSKGYCQAFVKLKEGESEYNLKDYYGRKYAVEHFMDCDEITKEQYDNFIPPR